MLLSFLAALTGIGGTIPIGLSSSLTILSTISEVTNMSFVNNNTNAPAATVRGRFNDAPNEKAVSFINIMIPTSAGPKKIGSIPLNASKPLEKAVHDLLIARGEEGLATLTEKITLSFNVNNSDAPVTLDF